ncbi:MAG: UDP-3-O-[3-hydroxymyristoyl] N-acetylglucosamine deacetylase [Spirochaetales bacterium]|nr:UDP-3-O-[3-hydroxymyristoyl] N-acetylglucosamine deacetylase [Leptospiraceae bacterium]MCP5479797.1 UDP-3-O-[3-hydroxymyristoyl] N-acetylglucosamine deacetylase [Spirochaetales bacterium]MCP5486948.1 UDP-3-O-[3-hydroxymyristoyl] N-acetylglucosamine deacetylase [Spirochaetales bacterium]
MTQISKRKTVAQIATLRGQGIHSGEQVTLRIRPAACGTGLVFISEKHRSQVAVSPFHVVGTTNAVTLGNREWHVQTVEHLLAALAAAGISDALLEVDAPEIPIMDGSSEPFYQAVQDAGIVEYEEQLEPIRLHTPVWVVDGEKYLVALPDDQLRVTYSIDFNHPLLKGQTISMDLGGDRLAREILPARTFGFLKDVEAMKAKGLIKGGSIENAIVLTDDGYLNESLRFEQECVRHKVLDLIGDLYLLGRPLIAHLIASRAGHALDVALGRKIYTQVAMNELQQRKETRFAGGPLRASEGQVR